MNRDRTTLWLFLLSAVVVWSNLAIAGRSISRKSVKHAPSYQISGADKTAVLNQFTMAGNNWAFEMTNFGSYAQDVAGRLPAAGGSGGEFPRGTGTYVIFAAGFQVGALVNGVEKVSAIDFDSEFQPGALTKVDPYDLTEVPIPTDPGSATNKLFALFADGSDGTPLGTNGDAIDDFANWPAQYGAPTRADGSPLIIGDLMSWCVYNDMDPSLHRIPDDSNKDPLGLEVQQASIQVNITGYSDVFFMYYKVINKGTQNLNDVYIAAWFDADVDKSGNDLVATDSLASMVFMYNSDNTDPHTAGGVAFGADFFQGPIVPGEPTDTARYLELTEEGFVQREVAGRKSVPLTTTVRYINVRGAEGDPDNDRELYNLMRGREKNGDPRANRFTYPEDPVAGNASLLDPRPDDKRMMLSTGPFNLSVGDTQVVVLACVGATGTDRIDAVKNLRATDIIAQQAYDAKFLLPQPPTSPNLTATALPGRVVLQWDNLSETVEDRYPALAGIDVPGYRGFDFAGYKIYRSPDGTVGSWEMLAQFDKNDAITEVPETTWVIQDSLIKSLRTVPIGDDAGLRYSYTDETVTNGQQYFYAVTAYDVQPEIRSGAAPITLESSQSANAVRAVPRPITLGNDLGATVENDTATHIGTSGGTVTVEVVDPTKVTGHEYRVVFEDIRVIDTLATPRDTSSLLVWRLWDVNLNSAVRFNRADDPRTDVDEAWFQVNQGSATDPSTVNEFATADGLLIKVFGPSLDFTAFEAVANGSGPLDPPEAGSFGFNSSGFPHPNTEDRPADRQQVGGGHWGIHTGQVSDDFTYEFFQGRVTRNGGNWGEIVPFDFEIRFTADTTSGSMAWFVFTDETFHRVPFQLWNIGIGTPDDTTDDYQLVPYLLDANENGVFDLDGVDHGISGGGDDPETDWIYFYRPDDTSPGRAGYLAAEAEMIANTYTGDREHEVMARIVLVNWNGGSVTDPTFPANVNQQLPEAGTVFRISTTKPNAPADTFTVKTTARTAFNPTTAQSQMNKNFIKVVPNPYYAFSAYDQNQFNRRVKITGLPDVCTIRIFNVAGDLVRTIQHSGTSNNERAEGGTAEFTSLEVWDLTTDNGLFISSGIYFMHITAPGIGETDDPIPFAIIQGNAQLTVPTN